MPQEVMSAELTEERINEIVEKSAAVAKKKLEPANALIAEIKHAMSKGTECIPTVQLQEWAVAIPIICEELVPTKEAYVLTKNLWDIETKQLQAKNLLEMDEKKTKIGYEIPFTREFYKYTPLKPSADIFEELKYLEQQESKMMEKLLH